MSPRAPKTAKPKGLIRRKRTPTVTAPPTDPLPDAPKAATARAAVLAPSPRAAPNQTEAPDLTATPLDKISIKELNPRALIAPNFRVYELTKSDLASRRAIDNDFTSEQHLRAAIHLARHVLQPIRDTFGSFTPNSVYRSQALERVLKNKPTTWLSTSQHARGEACDIEIVGMATLALASWARDHLADFDQIICECYNPRQGPNSGWVHISLKAPGQGTNRRQCLSYVPDTSGRLVYVSGLQATA
jgi:uncharacterized protein YcbK (DUF882 family)